MTPGMIPCTSNNDSVKRKTDSTTSYHCIHRDDICLVPLLAGLLALSRPDLSRRLSRLPPEAPQGPLPRRGLVLHPPLSPPARPSLHPDCRRGITNVHTDRRLGAQSHCHSALHRLSFHRLHAVRSTRGLAAGWSNY